MLFPNYDKNMFNPAIQFNAVCANILNGTTGGAVNFWQLSRIYVQRKRSKVWQQSLIFLAAYNMCEGGRLLKV